MNKILKSKSFSNSLAKVLLALTLLIVVGHLLLQYLNIEVFYQQNGFAYELSNRFDLDDENSVPTWFSQLLFLLISLGAAFAAYLSKTKSLRRIWILISAVGLLLSLDEVSTLHEFILQSLHNLFYRDSAPTSFNNAWLLLTPLILLAVGWALYKIAKLLPRRTTILFAGATVIFLIGAIFFDALASITDRETFINQGVMIAIEESLELIGCVVAVYAISDYLERQHGSQIIAAFKNLK